MAFLTVLEVTETLCSFKLVLEGKAGKEIPESSRLEFLQRFSVKNFDKGNKIYQILRKETKLLLFLWIFRKPLTQ